MNGTSIGDVFVIGPDETGKGFLVECVNGHTLVASPRALEMKTVACRECAEEATALAAHRDLLRRKQVALDAGLLDLEE